MAPSARSDRDGAQGRDRRAVLLGAGSPWGGVLAEGLGRHGYSVLLVDEPGEGLRASRARLREGKGDGEVLETSWNDLTDVLRLPQRLPQEWKGGPLLVYALPPPIVGRFSERDPQEIVREVHRGYSSLVAFAHDLLPGMIEQGAGRLIVLGSPAARAPVAKAAVHSALARALPAFLTSLELEVYRQGIRVTYLEPGGYATPPLPEEIASGRTALHQAHRRFWVGNVAVAQAFEHALHRPGSRTLRFHGHLRSPPSASVLRRYTERELHAQVPEDEAAGASWAATHVPPRDLQGRIAVVTGGSRGIGRAIAVRLARRGMRLVLTGRDTTGLERTAEEVRKGGGEARTVALDLLKPGAPQELLRFTQGTWGTPWLLVNNAGLAYFRRLVRQDERQLTEQIQVDLLGLLLVARAFLPSMLLEGRGEVLNIGSMAPEVPLPRLATYSGIKGAVKGFTVALDRETSHRGVCACVLEPITVNTDLISRGAEPGRRDLRERGSFQRLIIGPEEVALLAERTIVDPRPVVIVPPRARPFYWAYRALYPLVDRSLRLPPPRREEGARPPP